MRYGAIIAGAAALIGAACGADDEQPAPQADAQLSTLPEEVIEELEQRYPVLREEPAPEPQPRPDAEPERVPEGVRQALPQRALQVVTGEATFYANRFEGRRTASGIPFRQNQLVAAHRAFPFGTLLRVTNTANNRAVNVRVVDRGPFGSSAHARRTVLDLSRRAAEQLGYVNAGRAQVRVEVLEWGSGVPTV